MPLSLLLALVGFLQRQSAIARNAEAEERLAVGELFEAQSQMTWIHFDLLLDAMVAEVEEDEIGESRLELFHRDRQEAIEVITRIAERDSTSSRSANELLDFYDDVEFDNWPYDAFDLLDQHYVGIDVAESASPTSELSAEQSALPETMLPALILADALAIELVQGAPATTQTATQTTTQASTQQGWPEGWPDGFVRYLFNQVSTAPGWLGFDRTDPLADSYVSSFDNKDSLLEPTGRDLEDLRSVWDYDQWMINNAESGFATTPPSEIGPFIDLAESVTDTLRSQLRESVADRQAVIGAQTTDPGVATRWLFVTVMALFIAVAILLPGLYRQWQRHRHLNEIISLDALTGARNRRYLEHELAEICREEDMHHVVVMIDLDRFKLVNDTWGHDIGDAVLKAASDRLRHAADILVGSQPDALGAVVRPGGDEFMVVLHGPQPFDLRLIEERIRAIAGPIELGVDEPIVLEFSVGIASAHHPVDIADLTKSADLAAYQDKTLRAANRNDAMAGEHDAITIDIH